MWNNDESVVEMDKNNVVNEKKECNMCLMEKKSIIEKLKENKKEEEIRKEIDKMC